MTTAQARAEFTAKHLTAAKKATAGTGLYPETLLAMAITESSAKVGNIYVPGASKLSKEANNFFGIKADSSWKGPKAIMRTKEYDSNGKAYYVNEPFRKYPSVLASFKDWVKFLKKNKRYEKAKVFTAPDYVSQITRIARAGYATAPNYSEVVSSIAKQVRSFLPDLKDMAGTLAILAGALAALLTVNFSEDEKV